MFKNYRFINRIYIYTFTLNFNPNFFKLIITFIPTFIPTIPTTMARTEEEWAVIASKYRYGININKTIKDKLVEFI